jgi:hypothetical protein
MIVDELKAKSGSRAIGAYKKIIYAQAYIFNQVIFFETEPVIFLSFQRDIYCQEKLEHLLPPQ